MTKEQYRIDSFVQVEAFDKCEEVESRDLFHFDLSNGTPYGHQESK